MFNYYQVFGVRYKVTFSVRDANNFASCATYLSTSTTQPDEWTEILELPDAKHKIFPPYRGGVIQGYCSLPRLLGRPLDDGADSADCAAVGASPVNIPTLNIFTEAVDQASTVDVDVRLEMTYLARFFQHKTVAQS